MLGAQTGGPWRVHASRFGAAQLSSSHSQPANVPAMQLSADLMRYVIWAGVVAIGAILAVVDRRWARFPLFGILLAAGIGGGLIITRVSPFNFGGGSHYMEGVIISGGSALALAGYILAFASQLACRRFTTRGRR
jgi:uncharacterized membrane protein